MFFLCPEPDTSDIDDKPKQPLIGVPGAMIVCSCNVLSDADVRTALNVEAGPRTAGEVYGCLGCSPQCGRCAPTIRQIMDDAVGRQRGPGGGCR